MLRYGDLKISLVPGNAIYFGQGKQLYVNVPADLDQFGRKNSHGTVIGGKGFIQLRHHPADGAGFFNQIHIKTGISQIQSRLHSRDSAAYHHYRSDYMLRHCLILLVKQRAIL
jgi:hypothetical protein